MMPTSNTVSRQRSASDRGETMSKTRVVAWSLTLSVLFITPGTTACDSPTAPCRERDAVCKYQLDCCSKRCVCTEKMTAWGFYVKKCRCS